MRNLFFQAVIIICFYFNYSHAQCTFRLPANTIIVHSDDSISAIGLPFNSVFLVCPGVTMKYFDNSYTNKICLEPGAKLELFGYGYSKVYVKSGAEFDANFIQYDSSFSENGATLTDTLIMGGFSKDKFCSGIQYDYSLMTSSTPCITNAVQKNKPAVFKLIEICPRIFRVTSMVSGTLQIIDISGRVLQVENLQEGSHDLNISSLSPGIYHVLINAEFVRAINLH